MAHRPNLRDSACLARLAMAKVEGSNPFIRFNRAMSRASREQGDLHRERAIGADRCVGVPSGGGGTMSSQCQSERPRRLQLTTVVEPSVRGKVAGPLTSRAGGRASLGCFWSLPRELLLTESLWASRNRASCPRSTNSHTSTPRCTDCAPTVRRDGETCSRSMPPKPRNCALGWRWSSRGMSAEACSSSAGTQRSSICRPDARRDREPSGRRAPRWSSRQTLPQSSPAAQCWLPSPSAAL
jgi:hypothetical protein